MKLLCLRATLSLFWGSVGASGRDRLMESIWFLHSHGGHRLKEILRFRKLWSQKFLAEVWDTVICRSSIERRYYSSTYYVVLLKSPSLTTVHFPRGP